MKERKTIKTISILGITILILQIVFVYNYLYVKIWWLDIPMHIVSGTWVGLIFFYWFFEKTQFLKKDGGSWPTLILCVSFTVLIGVLWEFFEFSLDSIFATLHQQSLSNTMRDILDDLVGGILASIIYLFKK